MLGNNTLVPNTASVISWIGGAIDTDTSWAMPGISGYQIVGTVTVNPGRTLTVPAGMAITFGGTDLKLDVQGALQAFGTAAQPIVFDAVPVNTLAVGQIDLRDSGSQLHHVTVSGLRHYTPSETAYTLLNQSPIGNPDNPAPSVTMDAALVDRSDYGRGAFSGHTNKWGLWTEATDGLGRTSRYVRDDQNNLTQERLPSGDCITHTYDERGHRLSTTELPAAECSQPPKARRPA